jgi:hypothetical protein
LKAIIVAAFLIMFLSSGQASSSAPIALKQAATPADSTKSSQSQGEPCLFDFERGQVPDCVRKHPGGAHFIAPQFVKELTFDSDGLAAVHSQNEGWMYANRKGTVIITGVPMMDNGADTFHDGLVRFVRKEKYGFADRHGKIVIPPTYDGAMNFENGVAEVCNHCKTVCASADCEYHAFGGGEWYRIDAKGALLVKLQSRN